MELSALRLLARSASTSSVPQGALSTSTRLIRPVPPSQMPSASSVVDHFEAAALKDEFDAAVEHLTQLTMASTTLDGPELTEAVERRLFSLHARVTRGVPPAEPPAKADEAEQWAAWDETRAMSAEAAQQEYIDLVRRHTAGFDALDELDGDGGGDGAGGGEPRRRRVYYEWLSSSAAGAAAGGDGGDGGSGATCRATPNDGLIFAPVDTDDVTAKLFDQFCRITPDA